MEAKQDSVLEMFYNSPRRWSFSELQKKAVISRPQLAHWLRELERQGLIKRIKKPGKMPYYVGAETHSNYQNKKRLFAIQKLQKTGFIDYLSGLEGPKVIIIFGSISRYDWYDTSDIDIFIYGELKKAPLSPFYPGLNKMIQWHIKERPEDLIKMGNMLNNILSGYYVKGNLDDIGVKIHAEI